MKGEKGSQSQSGEGGIDELSNESFNTHALNSSIISDDNQSNVVYAYPNQVFKIT